MQCLITYDMETANIITINTDDKNLAEVIKKIIAEAGLTVGELFNDDDIIEYIHESGLPADEIYDEDDILDCGCVTDKIEELMRRDAQAKEDFAEEEEEEEEEDDERFECSACGKAEPKSENWVDCVDELDGDVVCPECWKKWDKEFNLE